MKERYPRVYRMLPPPAIFFVDRWKDFSPHTINVMLKSSFAILCLALFIRLTFSINSSPHLQTFDESILRWVESLRTPLLNLLMLDITALGGLALSIVLGLVAIAMFFLTSDPAAALHLTLTSAGGFFISNWSKGLISRPRPSVIPQLIHAAGFSYPSGHAVTSAALYLTMAILACRHFKSIKSKMVVLSLAAFMIILISFSRIYLGVHYPSDTISGALIGLSWALLMAALFAKIHWTKIQK